ncbi:MAG: glyoxalase [Betaproteobacteria bacterium RIFCSPLOWO2_12_FULL_62_13]|nr:MAG: glyoxalase [Betaproteobacteria bacterium RIFCSPLOWO2_12_FULL_62_13]
MSTVPSVALAHIGLYVRDLERMEQFYTNFLGLIVTDRGDLGAARLVFLSRDPREHHQVVLVSGRPETVEFSVLNQISLRVPGLAALRYFQANAAVHGGHDVQAITHGNAISVYVRDPEGNRIELYIDTPWYVTQPLRAPVDLAKPDEAVWREVESLARSLPGFRPVEEWRRELESRLAAV